MNINTKWYLALALVLVMSQFPAKADYINLEGADLIGEAQVCVFHGQIFACVVLEQNGKRYKVVADTKGELEIWQVETKEENGQTIIIHEVLVWARNSV